MEQSARKADLLHDVNVVERIEDAEDDEPAKQRFAFSDSSEESSEEESSESETEVDKPPLPAVAVAEEAPAAANDDDLLDALILENMATSSATEHATGMPYDAIFDVDSRQLDMDLAMRNRFLGTAAPRNSGGRSTRTFVKRFTFCIPRQDWPKPPALISGGQGMVRCGESLFRYEWSDAYALLQQRFQLIQETGDANLLVMFVANHPHHCDALLALAAVFGRMGRPERSADLIRRCLYVCECAFMEAFRPWQGFCCCQMDPSCAENSAFFAALHRYTLLATAAGHTALAANLALLTLSLNPMDEACAVLLRLDFLLLSAARYEEVQVLCGYHHHGHEQGQGLGHWEQSYLIEDGLCLGHLPSWWFSLALATWHLSQRSEAEDLLTAAIRRWPAVLLQLFAELLPSSPMLVALRQSRRFTSVPADALGDVYVLRQAALWNRPELLQWLANCSNKVLLSTSSEMQEEVEEEGGALRKYHSLINKEDFSDTIVRFPDGLQPVDDQLADPAVLAGQARFPQLDRLLETQQVLGTGLNVLQDSKAQGSAAEEVDLGRPLLQLLFATLLPWVRVPRYRR